MKNTCITVASLVSASLSWKPVHLKTIFCGQHPNFLMQILLVAWQLQTAVSLSHRNFLPAKRYVVIFILIPELQISYPPEHFCFWCCYSWYLCPTTEAGIYLPFHTLCDILGFYRFLWVLRSSSDHLYLASVDSSTSLLIFVQHLCSLSTYCKLCSVLYPKFVPMLPLSMSYVLFFQDVSCWKAFCQGTLNSSCSLSSSWLCFCRLCVVIRIYSLLLSPIIAFHSSVSVYLRFYVLSYDLLKQYARIPRDMRDINVNHLVLLCRQQHYLTYAIWRYPFPIFDRH